MRHGLRLGELDGAEDVVVPCALTVTTAKEITTSSLENMKIFFEYLVDRERRREAT